MKGFPGGLVVGGAMVLLVGLTFVGTPDVLEEALGALDAPLAGVDQVLVGHFVLFKGDRAWMGSTVYAPGIQAAEQLEGDLETYKTRQGDQTPPTVRDVLCAQGGCVNGTGEQILLQDLGNATLALRQELDATLLGSVDLSVVSLEQGRLRIALVEVAPHNFTPGPIPNASIVGIQEELRRACQERLPVDTNGTPVPLPGDKTCDEIYALNSVTARWDPSRSVVQKEPLTDDLGVLGPLTWTSKQVLPDGQVLPPMRAPAFVPTAALLWVLGAVLLAVILHYFLEGFVGNAALPLPPVAMLTGVVLLFVIDAKRSLDYERVILLGYGIVLFAYVILYFYLDLAGVHFLTLLSTILIGVVGLVAIGTKLKDVLLDQPLGILTTLYSGQVTNEAADLAAKTLFTVGGACVAVLFLSALVAYRAARESRREVGQIQLRSLLATPTDDLWRALDLAHAKTRSGGLSWGAYASLTGRAYSISKRHTKGWWWKDPLPVVRVRMPAAVKPEIAALWQRPGTPAARARNGEEADAIDELWRRHVDAARQARRFANIRLN